MKLLPFKSPNEDDARPEDYQVLPLQLETVN